MKVLIVANGSVENKDFYKRLIRGNDVIIAADGGAGNCIKLGIKPHHVIGDLDSISKKARKKFDSIIIHDKSQKTTDMEKAISLAKKLGCTKLSIIGAIGSRMDHTLSNIISLLQMNANSEIFDETSRIFAVEKKIEINGKKGDIVSVIPISKVTGLTYTGLKWGVKDKTVNTGWIGISNIMTGKKASIKLKSGKIIVIKTHNQ